MGPKPAAAELAGKKKAYGEAKTAITAALKPSGLDAAIGKPLMPAQEIVDAKIGAADPVTVVPALWDAVVKAGPGLGMKQKQPFMKVGPFTALKVEGDHATVKSGPRTMKIDKIGGKWLIDAPLPEPSRPASSDAAAGPAARQDRPRRVQAVTGAGCAAASLPAVT